jgi:hypothetical protein
MHARLVSYLSSYEKMKYELNPDAYQQFCIAV